MFLFHAKNRDSFFYHDLTIESIKKIIFKQKERAAFATQSNQRLHKELFDHLTIHTCFNKIRQWEQEQCC